MSLAGEMYVGATSLSSRAAAQTVYPLAAYRHLEAVLTVPIVHIEFRTIARHLPIAFVRQDGRMRSVAVLGLGPGHTLLANLSETRPEELPLLLRAFPLAPGQRDEQGHMAILIHDPPHHAGGAGRAAFERDGTLTEQATEKSDSLWLYAAAEARSEALWLAFEQAEAFEPWKIALVFDDGTARVEDLFTIKPDFIDTPDYLELLAAHGMPVASAVEHHLLSKPKLQRLSMLQRRIRAREESRARGSSPAARGESLLQGSGLARGEHGRG